LETARLQKERKARNSWRGSTLTEAEERSLRELRPIARDRIKWKNS
jgi:hypothetical protein